MAEICLQHVALPNENIVIRQEKLINSIKEEHIECVKNLVKLIKPGYLNKIIDKEHKSLLELALNNYDITKLLLDNKISANGDSANYLEIAVNSNDTKLVKLLLEYGAETEDYYINDNNEKRLNINHESPLINSLWKENNDIFFLLLYHGSYLECYINDKNSIPHIIIASYRYANNALDALKIYKQFGGNLWSLQPDLQDRTTDNETALQSLKRQPKLYVFNGDNADNIEQQIEELMNKPLSLQSLCRIKIFHTIGRNYYKDVSKLKLPNSIINLLQFTDVYVTSYVDYVNTIVL